MRKLLGWMSILVWVGLCVSVSGAADPAKKTTPQKKTSSVKTKKKAVAKGKTGSKAAPKKSSGGKSSGSKAGKKATKSGKKAAPRTTWRNRQTEPTPERYKEIQDALVAKGFLKPEDASGAWGANSADALKRFQAGQNIESTGKIDSLSLIALGLGPKREAVAAAKPPEQPQAP